MNSRFFICCLFLLFLAVTSDRLLSIQVIFRHGARFPYMQIKNDIPSEQAALHHQLRELTPQGKSMQYLLGKTLYRNYWHSLFKDTPYERTFNRDQIYVYSTNTNRTIQSAMAQLVGLLEDLEPEKLPIEQLKYSLPPFEGVQQLFQITSNATQFYVYGEKNKHIHAVPVFTQSSTEEMTFDYKVKHMKESLHNDFLVKIAPKNCPKNEEYKSTNIKEELKLILALPMVQSYFKKVSKELGYEVGFELYGSNIYDNYEIQTYMGAPTLSIFKDPQMLRVASFLRFAFQIYENTYTLKQRQIASSWMLQELLSNMKKAIESKGPKINLFSGHDLSMIVILGALKFYTFDCIYQNFIKNTTNPDCLTEFTGLGSSVVFELWEKQSKEYYLKVVYNGQSKKIPVCGHKEECPLQEFEKWAQTMYVDPNKQCHLPRFHLETRKQQKTQRKRYRHSLNNQ